MVLPGSTIVRLAARLPIAVWTGDDDCRDTPYLCEVKRGALRRVLACEEMPRPPCNQQGSDVNTFSFKHKKRNISWAKAGLGGSFLAPGPSTHPIDLSRVSRHHLPQTHGKHNRSLDPQNELANNTFRTRSPGRRLVHFPCCQDAEEYSLIVS